LTVAWQTAVVKCADRKELAMTVKAVTYVSLIMVVVLGAALVIGAVLLDVPAGIVSVVQPDVYLGVHESVGEQRTPTVISVEPARTRVLDVRY
jgi:hypothetical protein